MERHIEADLERERGMLNTAELGGGGGGGGGGQGNVQNNNAKEDRQYINGKAETDKQ